jgi:hypothetical protein
MQLSRFVTAWRSSALRLSTANVESAVHEMRSFDTIVTLSQNSVPIEITDRVKVKLSRYTPGQALGVPWGWGSSLDSRQRKVVRLSALRTGRPYPQEEFLELISVRGWVDPRDTMRPEGLSYWKIPVTPSGIEPATFQFVAQWLTGYLRFLRDNVMS